MEAITRVTHAEDIAYVKHHFIPLAQTQPGRPAASYVLDDGTHYVPRNYFEQECDRDRFIARYLAQAAQLGVTDAEDAAQDAWTDFLTGIYGVCLREVTPENIVLKGWLIERIDVLTQEPQPQSAAWIANLRDAVDTLDALEMPFSPVFDRERFNRPPSRDTFIRDVRARYFV